ncbi:hypothetical protein WJX77_005150 [Trebouxia sp. C0004]
MYLVHRPGVCFAHSSIPRAPSQGHGLVHAISLHQARGRGRTSRAKVCMASNLPLQLPVAIQPVVSSRIVQGCSLLIVLAAVDAAFSGDWSRIGAISKDTELWLQSALGLLGMWHLIMGAAAYSIAEQHGRPKLLATIKALAVGTIPVLELMLDIQTEHD